MPIRLLPMPALRLSPFLAATALALASAGSHADAQVVKLKFDWPDGLQADVKQTSARTRSVNGQRAATVAQTSTYVMSARKIHGKMLISHTQMRLLSDAKTPRVAATELSSFDLFSYTGLPSYFVSAEGEFIDTHDLEAFKQTVFKTLDSIQHDDPVLEQQRKVMNNLVEGSLIKTAAFNEWSMLVSSVVGGELKVDKAYETRNEEALPNPPNPKVIMVSRFSVGKPFLCKRAALMHKCVALEITTTPDPDELAKAVERTAANLLSAFPAHKPPTVKSIEVETKFRLITEPNGLIPHQYSLRKSTKTTTSNGKENRTLTEVQESSAVYTYQ